MDRYGRVVMVILHTAIWSRVLDEELLRDYNAGDDNLEVHYSGVRHFEPNSTQVR